MFLHGRLWAYPLIGPRAPFSVVEHELPVDKLDDEFPIRLTTGRTLDDYNTGVQTGKYSSPLRRHTGLEVSPEDARQYQLNEGDKVRVTSRRGSVVAPVRFDFALRPGLAFLSIHDHEEVSTNDLTIDAVDPRSGTSEFKATAIRIEKM
jgi:formate dehydrogenase major subunit